MARHEGSNLADTETSPQRVGVYDLRTHWYEYLRRARDGEVFIVTRRGKPVAILEPLPPDHPALQPGAILPQLRLGSSARDD